MTTFMKALGASACSDLLKRDYVSDTPWKVSVTHPGASPVLKHMAHVSRTGTLTSFSALKHTFPWGFIETKFGTTSTSADASFKSKLLPGTTLRGHFERKYDIPKGPKDVVDLSFEFTKEESVAIKQSSPLILVPHLKFAMDPLSSRWTAHGTTGIGFTADSSLRFGGEVTGTPDLKAISYSAGASFTQTTNGKLWVASLLSSPHDGKPFGKWTGTVYCKNLAPGSPEIGAEITHYDSQTDVAFGGQWYLKQGQNGGKSDATLKLKLTQDAKIGASFTHKISDALTATIGSQIDAFQPKEIQYGLSFGITV